MDISLHPEQFSKFKQCIAIAAQAAKQGEQ